MGSADNREPYRLGPNDLDHARPPADILEHLGIYVCSGAYVCAHRPSLDVYTSWPGCILPPAFIPTTRRWSLAMALHVEAASLPALRPRTARMDHRYA